MIEGAISEDNASKGLREELLTSCNLHTILDCPGGTFIGAGVKTVVLFFEKQDLSLDVRQTQQGNGPLSMFPMATERIWYYLLDPGRSLGKTNPLNDDDLGEFVEFQETFKESDKSWLVEVKDIDREMFDLSVKNPNAPEEDPFP